MMAALLAAIPTAVFLVAGLLNVDYGKKGGL